MDDSSDSSDSEYIGDNLSNKVTDGAAVTYNYSDGSDTSSNESDYSQSGDDSSYSSDNEYIGDNLSNQVTDGPAVTYDLKTTGAVLGATTVAANVGEDSDNDANEMLVEISKLLVGAYISHIKDEASGAWNNVCDNASNFVTMFNTEITVLNKSAVTIADAAAAEFNSLQGTAANVWSDFFMPTELSGELSATKVLKNPLIKGIGEVGGKIGVIGTVLNPIMEYNNSLESYKDDIEAAYEIDPENAGKYDIAMHAAAGLDAGSFGYMRGVANTVPTVVQLLTDEDPKWTSSWINNINYWVNSRNLMNEMDKAFKDPVKGPIIKQFLR